MFRLNCSRFYNYEEMKTWLEGMAKEHPDKMRLETLTETPEGRAVHVVTLADFSLGDEAEKRSAYFVKAGVHAQETAGTTAAMAVIERVLEKTPEVLKDIVFYVIPRVNPDGTELAISKSFRMIRSKLGFIDGLANALIPQDINGDGKILQMRRKNPAGNMKEHPECPGLMVPRKPCDKDCDFYDVWCEGVIENYDGGEPVPGFEHVDFNRIMPVNWRPVPGGEYPLQVPEVRAVAEFELSHRNIFAAVDIHCGSHAILRPLDMPDGKADPDDLRQIIRIGKIAEKITGFPLLSSYDEYITECASPGHASNGTSNSWNYELGRSHYVIELGNGFNSLGYDTRHILKVFSKSEDEWLVELVALHRKHGSEINVPWEPFEHPQLGYVEIGGLKGGNSYYMLGADMLEKIPRTTDFILRHAAMRPQLKIENVEVKCFAQGIYRVRCDVINIGEVGTRIMAGAKGCKSDSIVKTYIKSDNQIEIISRPAVYTPEKLDSMQRVNAEWFIRADSNSVLTLVSESPRTAAAVEKIKIK